MNLYGFVGNGPLSDWDWLGLNSQASFTLGVVSWVDHFDTVATLAGLDYGRTKNGVFVPAVGAGIFLLADSANPRPPASFSGNLDWRETRGGLIVSFKVDCSDPQNPRIDHHVITSEPGATRAPVISLYSQADGLDVTSKSLTSEDWSSLGYPCRASARISTGSRLGPVGRLGGTLSTNADLRPVHGVPFISRAVSVVADCGKNQLYLSWQGSAFPSQSAYYGSSQDFMARVGIRMQQGIEALLFGRDGEVLNADSFHSIEANIADF